MNKNIKKMSPTKEFEIKYEIAKILARPEANLIEQSQKLTDIYSILEKQIDETINNFNISLTKNKE